jgi:hypothetical protein
MAGKTSLPAYNCREGFFMSWRLLALYLLVLAVSIWKTESKEICHEPKAIHTFNSSSSGEPCSALVPTGCLCRANCNSITIADIYIGTYIYTYSIAQPHAHIHTHAYLAERSNHV